MIQFTTVWGETDPSVIAFLASAKKVHLEKEEKRPPRRARIREDIGLRAPVTKAGVGVIVSAVVGAAAKILAPLAAVMVRKSVKLAAQVVRKQAPMTTAGQVGLLTGAVVAAKGLYEGATYIAPAVADVIGNVVGEQMGDVVNSRMLRRRYLAVYFRDFLMGILEDEEYARLRAGARRAALAALRALPI